MNPFQNVGKLNDILFEKRNKQYGAYAIRSSYDSTLLKSLGITACVMIGGIWLLSIFINTNDIIAEKVIPKVDSLINVIFNADPLEPKQPEIEKPSGGAPKTSVAVSSNIRDKALDTAKTDINAVNTVVNTNTTSVTTATTTSTGTLTTLPTNTLTTTEPVAYFEDAPVFPGGLPEFWNRNLKYPPPAREAGAEGTVFINFVLDEEGKVIKCTVLKKGGYGFDEEVLRVVNLMPNWKPGKVGGKPVKVTFNQAVKFKLN